MYHLICTKCGKQSIAAGFCWECKIAGTVIWCKFASKVWVKSIKESDNKI